MEDNVIIGTAGHVDHGKSSLVRGLTGIETDRLKQEKQRGITIELGFAWFDLPDGRRAGIIDVPGHERFVRNMLAGAAGIDVVLLVVAADEGTMPQTREHVAILQLLGVETGIVAITKADLVDEEMLALVQEDISDTLEGTFLEQAPRVPVSVVSGQGVEELKETISQAVISAPSRPRRSFSRLPVDRVFVSQGFGAIVTGTLLDGDLAEGDQVLLMPGEIGGRVRQIQVHGNKVDRAFPGQRVAVNLAGVQRRDIQRGLVLFKGQGLEAVDKVAARFNLLAQAQPLTSNTRIRFHSGSSETLGRAVVLGDDKVEPGQDALVQFRLEQPVVVVRGDRYVIRSYSPVTTIGGGEIIEAGRRRLSRRKDEVVENLLVREQGSPQDLVLSHLNEVGRPMPASKLLARVQLPPEQLEAAIADLGDQILSFESDGEVWHFSCCQELVAKMQDILAQWHQEQPLRQGMPREELRHRLLPNLSSRGFASLLEKALTGTGIQLRGQELALAEHQIELSPRHVEVRDQVLAALAANPYSPPAYSQLGNSDEVEPVLRFLQEQGQVVKTGDLVFSRQAVDQAIQHLEEHFSQQDQLTLAQFRDYLDTSRKYALPLLEYLDGAGVTRRRGDVRLPGPALRR